MYIQMDLEESLQTRLEKYSEYLNIRRMDKNRVLVMLKEKPSKYSFKILESVNRILNDVGRWDNRLRGWVVEDILPYNPGEEGSIDIGLVSPNELYELLLRVSRGVEGDEPITVVKYFNRYVIVDGNRRYDARKNGGEVFVKVVESENVVRDAVVLNRENYNELERAILAVRYPFVRNILDVDDRRLREYELFVPFVLSLPFRLRRELFAMKDPYNTAFAVFVYVQHFNDLPESVDEESCKVLMRRVREYLPRSLSVDLKRERVVVSGESIIIQDYYSGRKRVLRSDWFALHDSFPPSL
jgi:hypothetical protein